MYAAYLIKRAIEEAERAAVPYEDTVVDDFIRAQLPSLPAKSTLPYIAAPVLASLPGVAGVVAKPGLFGAPYTENQLEKLKEVLGAQHARVETSPDNTLFERLMDSPQADTGRHVVRLGKKQSPAMLAHELGHLSGSQALSGLYGASSLLAKGLTPIGVYLAYRSGKKAKTEQEAVTGGAKGGAIAGSALGLPLLAEEARASLRASRALGAIKDPHATRGRAGLVAAWLSYLAGTVGAGAGLGAVASRAGFKRQQKKNREKNKGKSE